MGLITKAGKVVSGDESVLDTIRSGKAKLVLVASDASDNTKKKILDKASFYNTEVNQSYTSEELSMAIGKSGRMVLGITQKSFLKILKK